MNSITDHPLYAESYARWLQIYKATCSPATAEVRAHQAAAEYVNKRIERPFYGGRRHIGPDAKAEL